MDDQVLFYSWHFMVADANMGSRNQSGNSWRQKQAWAKGIQVWATLL